MGRSEIVRVFSLGRRPTFLLIILESVVVFTLSEEGDRFLLENLFGCFRHQLLLTCL